MSEITGLSADLISQLMANTRAKNTYGPKTLEFVDSDEAGINPYDQWPLEFNGKKASTVYQGFIKAVKDAELQDLILVKQFEGGVYLLHKERAGLVVTEALASA